MRKLLITTVAAALMAPTTALAATCADDYAQWKQEALKDGKLLSTIHTGKRAYLFRQKTAEMREAVARGDDATCRKLMAWFAAEHAKAKKVKALKRRSFASGGEFTAVQSSKLAKSANKKDFMDKALYDPKGMYIGTVDDVIYVDNQPRYVVVSRTNFMGAEGNEYYVPVTVLYTQSANDSFYINAPRDTFYQKMPHATWKDARSTRVKLETDASFQAQTDDYYKSISAFGQ